MTTRSDAYIQATLDLIYRNMDFPGIGDAAGIPGSATAGNLYVALLTEEGEVDYAGYVRQMVSRGGDGFTRAGNVVGNTADIAFPMIPPGTAVQSATKVGIYADVSAGTLLHTAELANPVPVQASVVPIIEAGAMTITGS